jgi:serine protease AprX
MTLSPLQFTRALTIALCVIGVGAPAAAQGRRSKLDKVLRAAASHAVPQRVIIQTRPGSRAALKRALQQHGDVVQAEHPGLNALTVVLHGEDLAALEADPSVLSVSIDAEVSSFGRPQVEALRRPGRDRRAPRIELLRETVGVSVLPFNGSGINVAVVDSGIDANRDLADNIAGFWDFTRNGIAAPPSDAYGHGTHVAGLIASNGLDSDQEFAGIAPSVRLYGFKVLDKNGRGRASDVVKALEFIVANKLSSAQGAFKIDIINLSLGHPIYEPAQSDPLVRAVEHAARAGILVVTAAGNNGVTANREAGYTGITSPGNAPSALTVGATDNHKTLRLGDDRIATFSSRGPTWFDGYAKPDVVAPGVALTSDLPALASLLQGFPHLREYSKSGRGSFSRLSGTSMASAVATGVAAIVLQASKTANVGGPTLAPNALKAVLQYTALPLKDAWGRPYDALTQGTGAINVRGAVTMAFAINTSMPSSAPWLRFQPEPVTVLHGPAHGWSRALLWDDNIVWGTDALRFNSPQWNDNIVWGTSLGDNIVWGTAAEFDNIVWGTSVDWAGHLVSSSRVIGVMHDDNIVWGTTAGLADDNIVWGTMVGDNIVWGTWNDDNIVWGTSDGDNIVWGTSLDNIVWGTHDDNIVWGTSVGSGR